MAILDEALQEVYNCDIADARDGCNFLVRSHNFVKWMYWVVSEVHNTPVFGFSESPPCIDLDNHWFWQFRQRWGRGLKQSCEVPNFSLLNNYRLNILLPSSLIFFWFLPSSLLQSLRCHCDGTMRINSHCIVLRVPADTSTTSIISSIPVFEPVPTWANIKPPNASWWLN